MNLKLKKRGLFKINICFVLFFLSLILIGVGFSIAETKIEANGIASMNTNLWDIYFENLDINSDSVAAINEAKIDENEPTLINFEVKLDKGKKYEFTVDVVNKGAFGAKVSDIELGGLTLEQKKYINYTVKYSSGEEIKVGDILPIGISHSITVVVEYLNNVDPDFYPRVNQNIELYIKISYVQQLESESNQNTKWDIHFGNLNVLDSDLNASAKVNVFDNSIINFNLKFDNPGQKYSFETDIVNNSTYNASISSIQFNGLTDEQKKYVTFNVTYADGGIINENDIIVAGASRKILVTLNYVSGLDDSIYPLTQQQIPLDFSITYIQK